MGRYYERLAPVQVEQTRLRVSPEGGEGGKCISSMLNTDGASKSKQLPSVGSELYLLTSLPLVCSPSLGKYSVEAL